jgi:hypothetical protein
MKKYHKMKYLTRKKNGMFLPIPPQNDKRQMYFDFYKNIDSPMENEKVLAKNERVCHTPAKEEFTSTNPR